MKSEGKQSKSDPSVYSRQSKKKDKMEEE